MQHALQSSQIILIEKYDGKVCFETRKYKWEDKKYVLTKLKVIVWTGLNRLRVRLL
jgi:hypothetical protein